VHAQAADGKPGIGAADHVHRDGVGIGRLPSPPRPSAMWRSMRTSFFSLQLGHVTVRFHDR